MPNNYILGGIILGLILVLMLTYKPNHDDFANCGESCGKSDDNSPPLPPSPTFVAINAACSSNPDNSRRIVWKVNLANNFYRNPYVLSFRLIVKNGSRIDFDDYIEALPFFAPNALEDEYYFQNAKPFAFNPKSSESFLYLYTVYRPFNAQSRNFARGEFFVLPLC